jgi:hypothetical protein
VIRTSSDQVELPGQPELEELDDEVQVARIIARA